MPAMRYTETADVYRIGAPVAGWEPAPAIIYSGIGCLKLYPIDSKLKVLLPTKPMGTILQTITYDNITVYPNDLLLIESGWYPIISVESWYARVIDTTYLTLTVEEPVKHAV